MLSCWNREGVMFPRQQRTTTFGLKKVTRSSETKPVDCYILVYAKLKIRVTEVAADGEAVRSESSGNVR